MSAKDSNRLPANRPLDQPQGKKHELRCFSTSGEQSEQEARYTQLFETLEEGVYFCTPEGKILDANPALVRMLGYANKEELLRTNVNKLYLEPDRRRALLLELEKKTTIHDREITLRRKDGTPLICLVAATATRDASGRLIRLQGTLVDITQRRREMQKRLHEGQEFARRLVESLPDGIVVLDTQGHYTFVSSRVRELLGYAPEELLGKVLGRLTHPDDRVPALELFHNLIAGRCSSGKVEYRAQHKDGSWRTFRANISPLFDADGKIAGVVASVRDVTESKRLEQQVVQSEKLAAVGQMLAGVAHELNNPLTAILGVSDLLREENGAEPMRRQLDLIHQQARRAAEIVRNLLAFSRPAVPRKVSLDLSELVRRTLQLHEYSLRVNNITVGLVSEPRLPSVVGDANQLIQVFLNLIINAEQAIREVRNHGTVRVQLGRSGGSVKIAFQDDGPGIRPDVLPRIFDPFFTTKRPGGGTGLGLSICMAILKEHRGNIEAEAVPGGGAQFTVLLPISSENADTPVEKAPESERVSLEGRSVLVVDNDESIRELLRTGLSARGVQVDCVASGEEALARATHRSYDAILCDLKMPRVSGEQIFERLQAQDGGKAQQFIFMMGDVLDSTALNFLSRSGARVVRKPFRIRDLGAVLSEALETSASRAC